jgi:hypothetical protein
MEEDDTMYAKGKGKPVYTKGYTTTKGHITTKGHDVYATKGAHEDSFARSLACFLCVMSLFLYFLSPRSFEWHSEIRVALLHPRIFACLFHLTKTPLCFNIAPTNTHVCYYR